MLCALCEREIDVKVDRLELLHVHGERKPAHKTCFVLYMLDVDPKAEGPVRDGVRAMVEFGNTRQVQA